MICDSDLSREPSSLWHEMTRDWDFMCNNTRCETSMQNPVRQSWRSVQDLLSLSSTLLLRAWMNPALPICNLVFTDNSSGLFPSVERLNLLTGLLFSAHRGWEEKIIKGLNWVLRSFADPKSTSWGSEKWQAEDIRCHNWIFQLRSPDVHGRKEAAVCNKEHCSQPLNWVAFPPSPYPPAQSRDFSRALLEALSTY